MKKLFLTISVAFLLLFSVNSANAFVIIDNWNLNLSVLNGETFPNTNSVAGLSDAVGIDHVNITGGATISQTVAGGSALGQNFLDSGYIQFDTWTPEGGGLTSAFGGAALFVEYVGLSGILNPDGTISFDTGIAQAGTIDFYLTEDNDGVHATNPNDDLLLASFSLLNPSGGSDLDFFGGGGADGVVGLTLELIETSLIDPLLFTDEFGDSLGNSAIYLHLANVNSLLDPNFLPNPDNSGVDSSGNGTSLIHVQNNGQYNIATVPEPATLVLLGFGLLGIAGLSRKKISC